MEYREIQKVCNARYQSWSSYHLVVGGAVNVDYVVGFRIALAMSHNAHTYTAGDLGYTRTGVGVALFYMGMR